MKYNVVCEKYNEPPTPTSKLTMTQPNRADTLQQIRDVFETMMDAIEAGHIIPQRTMVRIEPIKEKPCPRNEPT